MSLIDRFVGKRAVCSATLFGDWNTRRPHSLRLPELLTELDEYVSPLPLVFLTRLLSRLVIHAEDLREYLHFSPTRYQRNRIRLRPHYEALLLCWLPEHISPIHDHGDSSCAVAILMGQAIEIGFAWNPNGTLRAHYSQRLSAGDIVGSSGSDVHQVANWDRAGRPLVTLHIYSPPLRNMETYDDSRVVRVPASQVLGIRDNACCGVSCARRTCA